MKIAGEMKCGLKALKSERHGLLKPAPLGGDGLGSLLYNNNMIGCNTAFLFRNRNREYDGENSGGLRFECNYFLNNRNDVYIDNFNATDLTWGVKYEQNNGQANDVNASAGNRFVQSVSVYASDYADNVKINEDPDYGFATSHKYLYHPSEVANPLNPEIATEILVSVDLGDCSQDYNFNGGGEEELRTQALQNYTASKQVYNALIDGGNTEELIDQVYWTTYQQALSTYQQLLAQSPALSDEVMVEAIKKEYDLPAPLLTAVLAANPSAAKSGAVLQALAERNDPLDTYQMEQVMYGQNLTSQKEILSLAMANARSQYHRATRQLMQQMMNSEEQVYNTADYIALLQPTLFLEDYLLVAQLHFEADERQTAISMLTACAQQYKLTENTQEMINKQIIWLSLEKQIIENQNGVITNEQKIMLEDTRENAMGEDSGAATSLLERYAGYIYIEQVLFPAEGTLHSAPVSGTKSVENRLEVYPNPTSVGYSLVKLKTLTGQVDELILYNSLGSVLLKQTVLPNQTELLIDTQSLAAGSYLIVASKIGQVIERTTLIVQ